MSGTAKRIALDSTKVATIEARHAVRIGCLSDPLWAKVDSALRGHLGFA
jgi:hypothetical protein